MKSYRIGEISFNLGVRQWFHWFHHTRPFINHKHRSYFKNGSILKRSSFNFDCLKRLKIGHSSTIDLDVINRFAHLEELDIDLVGYDRKKMLSLANLKTIYVRPSVKFTLCLKSPRLAEVYTLSLSKLEFIFPKSIRCIHTSCHAGKLSKFRNLEQLHFTDHYIQSDKVPVFEEFSLEPLENLKEIDFHYSAEYEKMYMSIFKKMIANIFALNRSDLKVFWQKVPMTNANLLTEYEHIMRNAHGLVTFQLQHYEKLRGKIHYVWPFHFNGSTGSLQEAGFDVRSEEFSSKFFANFSFRLIGVHGPVKEQEFLLELISRSPGLLSLNFSRNKLDQSFFERMTESIGRNRIPLRTLQLNKCLAGVHDLEFVTKLQDLKEFKCDQPLPYELFLKLLHLSKFTVILFSLDKNMQVERVSKDKFCLNTESMSQDELLMILKLNYQLEQFLAQPDYSYFEFYNQEDS